MSLANLILWLTGQAPPLPGKLTVDKATGKVVGPAKLQYNDPFPTNNGQYGSGSMMGVVMHTMVGNLPGTVAWFNNPNSGASAHFGIGQQGVIHQFGPIGKGWEAWAEMAGNSAWYSIEHADNGDPNIPLTYAQRVASAQLVECLSAFAGFPLEVSDSVDTQGYGTHAMGGQAWGGHSCPDLPPKHVRSAQRAGIIAMAKAIRKPPPKYIRCVAPGGKTVAQLAALHGVSEADLVEASVEKLTPENYANLESVVTGKLLRGMPFWIKK